MTPRNSCLTVLAFAVVVPIFLRIFRLWPDLGFYSTEAISLSITNSIYWILYCHSKKMRFANSRRRVGSMIIISIGTIVATITITVLNNQYIAQLATAMKSGVGPNEFRDNALSTTNAANYFLAWIYNAFTYDPTIDGFLGIFFGGFSALTLYIGSTYKVGKSAKEQELYKSLISCIALLSVSTSIMIFAANNPNYVYSVKHIFAVMSLLVGALFLTLGYLLAATKGRKDIFSLPQSILLVVSFAIGFTYGALLMPLTRVMIHSNPSDPAKDEIFFIANPGAYFFAYSAMITLALLLYLLQEYKTANVTKYVPYRVLVLRRGWVRVCVSAQHLTQHFRRGWRV